MVDAVCIHAYNSNDPNVHNLNVDDQLVVCFRHPHLLFYIFFF